MAKGEARADDRDPTAAVAAVLDAARGEAVRLGKAGRRRLDRLERRITSALRTESKRRRQFDEARTDLADLVSRVADLVGPTDQRASAEPAAPAADPTPEPKAAKVSPKTSAARAAAPKSAAPKAPARKSAAPKSAAPAAPSAAPRRRSLRGTRGSAGGPGS
jgi:hypothetical protein